MERLEECADRLEALSGRDRADFDRDRDARDIAERNFEIAAQCVIDIALRALSLEQAPRTTDAHDAILGLGTLGVLSAELARSLAPIARFRNVLAHEYVSVDWDLVYAGFRRLGELRAFASAVRSWLRGRRAGGTGGDSSPASGAT